MDNDLLMKRMRELALRAQVRPGAQFTHFLDPAQLGIAIRAARERNVLLRVWGGYPEAERAMAAFFALPEDEPEQFPLATLRLGWNKKFGSPGHRDLLGAVMSLGFDRERIGDIVLCEECAYLFAEPDTAGYISSNLESAGRVSLRPVLAEGTPELPPPKGRTVRDTVPSLRLDALLAAGFDLSRSQACELIARQVVMVNHELCESVSATLKEGDLISARGFGRFRLQQVGGLTRKGRLGVTIFRYGE